MSSHYRRIINAKKIVDTSPPSCYKPRNSKNNIVGSTESIKSSKSKQNLNSRNISPVLTQRSVSTNSYKGSSWGTESGVGSSRYHAGCVPHTIKTHGGTKYVCFDMGLVDLITYDTKNSPEVYCNGSWVEIKSQHNDIGFKPTEGKKEKFTLQSGKISKLEYQSKKNESEEKRKNPIRIPNKSSPEISIGSSPKTPKDKDANIEVYSAKDANMNLQKNFGSVKEQSQTSSRDSAYNGGISSLPESRSPTPDQKLIEEKYFVKKDPYFHHDKNNLQSSKRNEKKKFEDFPENSNNFQGSLDLLDCKLQNEEALKKMKEDGLYIKFIQDITVEILEKCLYTNKSLKKVMRRHILANLENLNKERMIKEVENLRMQLGIPEDKTIFDFEKEVMDSFSDLASPCSFISDSEFILPKDAEILKSFELNPTKIAETDDVDTEISKSTINYGTAANVDESQQQAKQSKDEKKQTSFSLESECDEEDELLSYIDDVTKNKGKNIQTLLSNTTSTTCSSDESTESPQKTKRSKLRGRSAKDRKLSRSSTSSSDIEENILEESADEAYCENERETEIPSDNFNLKGTTDESSNADICKNCMCITLKNYKSPCCNSCVKIQENITHHKIRATYETTITKTIPK